MKVKLDENLSPSLASLFAGLTTDIHSVAEQALNGKPDERVIEVCKKEERTLITLDLDFSNIQAYPPSQYFGIVVLRLQNQAHPFIEAAIRQIVTLLPHEPLIGRLWIVEAHRVRIHE